MNHTEWEITRRQRHLAEREEEHQVLSAKIRQLRKARSTETDTTVLFKLEQQLEAEESRRTQLEQDIAQLVSPQEGEQPQEPTSPKQQAKPSPPAHPLRTLLLSVSALLVVVTVLWSSGVLDFPTLIPTPTPTVLPTVMPTPIPATPTPTTVPTATPAPKPTVTPTPDRIVHLRSEPRTVSANEVEQVFGLLDRNRRPLKYLQHNFEDQGEVVVDHATGLMWQKSGSDTYMAFSATQEYVKKLNARKFAGHDDWRLPTIPELMSLLEPERQVNGLYINPIFDKTQQWCWSADLDRSSGSAWYVNFDDGSVSWGSLLNTLSVRAVRS